MSVSTKKNFMNFGLYLFLRGVDPRRVVRHGVQDYDRLGGRILQVFDHAVKVEAARGLKTRKTLLKL